ncbi:MAG: endonuclease [Paludibacter sp.]|nr:endonuclease [Paludibacter sp.]
MNLKLLFSVSLFLTLTVSVSAVIPGTYYSTLEGKDSANLKTALHDIICQDTTHYLNYGSGPGYTWQGFYSTDRDPASNLVIDMYSDNLRYFDVNYVALGYKGFGMTIQIEHSVPKSWWGCDIDHPDVAAKDLNHLYPSDGTYNNYKSNYPLGVVTGTLAHTNGVTKIGIGTYTGYSGTVFEPADQYKGDFARSYFYVATAYQHYVKKWAATPENMMEPDTYPTLKPWAIQLLLEWNRMDPVSDKERTRVENVYAIQKNRNPYIDHPELIEYIWGNKKGLPYRTISGITSPVSHRMTLSPNPAKDLVQLNFDDQSGSFRYSIYSITGSLVSSGNSTSTTISVSNLQKGVYSCEVETGTEKLMSKLIIL